MSRGSDFFLGSTVLNPAAFFDDFSFEASPSVSLAETVPIKEVSTFACTTFDLGGTFVVDGFFALGLCFFGSEICGLCADAEGTLLLAVVAAWAWA